MDYVPRPEDKLTRENATIVFRGEEYRYVYSYYVEPTGETYTNGALDEVNYNQVYNQYRERHGIPFPDEIEKVKRLYNLSNQKLATILGFGENQIRNYLLGEVPNLSNGKTLAAIRDVGVFEVFVESARSQIGEKSYSKIKECISRVKGISENPITPIIFRKERSIFNGYAAQNVDKLKDVILCALSKMGNTFMTKMNKVLFYIDMLHYRNTGMAITGLAYKSEQYGIIPFRSNKIYSLLEIPQDIFYDNGREYAPFYADGEPILSNLSESERGTIEYVCEKFRDFLSADISKENHKEDVWARYRDTGKPIPFGESFNLTQI